MNGSSESHPPRFTPLAGVSAYDPHEVDIGGEFELALFESSHSEFSPMTGRPPTVTVVYVTLNSVVSYQEKGSKSVPFASVGISDSDTPFRFEFEGLLSLEDDVLELVEFEFEEFF